MTAFTTATHLCMSWPRWIQFTSFHLIYLWFLLKLNSHLRLRLSRGLFPLDFSGKIPLRISFLFSHYCTFLTSQLFTPSPNSLHQDKRALDGKVHSWKISISFPLIKLVPLIWILPHPFMFFGSASSTPLYLDASPGNCHQQSVGVSTTLFDTTFKHSGPSTQKPPPSSFRTPVG